MKGKINKFLFKEALKKVVDMRKGTLNDLEVEYVRGRFREKNSNSNPLKFDNTRRVTSNMYEKLLGFLGEMAFAEYFNVYPQSLFKPDATCLKNVFDFKVSNNTWEVKTIDAAKTSRNLIVNLHDHEKHNYKQADFYCLIAVTTDRLVQVADYEIRGWCHGADLFKPENLSTNENYTGLQGLKRPAYVLHQGKMNEFKDCNLWRYEALNR